MLRYGTAVAAGAFVAGVLYRGLDVYAQATVFGGDLMVPTEVLAAAAPDLFQM